LGENNEKMSKSRGNVVNPDEILESHGADAFRVYEMFMGPLEAALPWSSSGLDGSRRWIERVYRLFIETPDKLSDTNDGSLNRIYHQTVKKVTNDVETLNLNTAISQMMIFINECYKVDAVYREYALGFIKMFACFAPHVGEEIYQALTGKDTVTYEAWPTYEENMLIEDEIEIAVQVNGKMRGTIAVALDEEEEVVKEKALAVDNVKAQLEGKTIRKVIVVKNRIVNIVAN